MTSPERLDPAVVTSRGGLIAASRDGGCRRLVGGREGRRRGPAFLRGWHGRRGAAAAAIRRYGRSSFMRPTRRSPTCAGASPRRSGPSGRRSTDASQGVQLATMQKLARYWATDYDWRKVEARLNALPQFITEIDGLDIHFIHVRSKHRERAAGHRHARLARLGHRAAEDHRSADQSDGAWRERIGRVRRRDSVAAGPRLFGQADRRPAGIPCASHAPGSC